MATKLVCDVYGTSKDVQACTIILACSGGDYEVSVEADLGPRGRKRAAKFMERAISLQHANKEDGE